MLYATIETIAHNGFIIIKLDNIKNRYIGYSRKGAIKAFRQEYGLTGKHIEFINL